MVTDVIYIDGDGRPALRLLAEIHREFGQPLDVIYIDLKAAFDSVDRAALWKSLKGIGAQL